MSDKLLLLGDKVHLWSLLASTHEGPTSVVVEWKSVMREALVVHALIEWIEAALVKVSLVAEWLLLFVFLAILARLSM